MAGSETEPAVNGSGERQWKEVRIKRRRRSHPKNPVVAWFDERYRKFRLWLVIGAMVSAGFFGFLMVRNYLDNAAASATAAAASVP